MFMNQRGTVLRINLPQCHFFIAMEVPPAPFDSVSLERAMLVLGSDFAFFKRHWFEPNELFKSKRSRNAALKRGYTEALLRLRKEYARLLDDQTLSPAERNRALMQVVETHREWSCDMCLIFKANKPNTNRQEPAAGAAKPSEEHLG